MTRVYEPRSPRDAFDWADRAARREAVEPVSLRDAAGRVLAEDLFAGRDLPDTDRSARDGYALRAADTHGASDYSPLPLRLSDATRPLGPGCAATVSDGDPLPGGADAVLALEQGETRGTILEVGASLAPGEGVAAAGEETRGGELLLPAWRRLRPQDVAQIARLGLTELSVLARPRVAVLLAGRFGTDADGPMLGALVRRDGGEVSRIDALPDEGALVEALRDPGADLVLVAGGTGLAAGDHAVRALEAAGAVQLDGIAIQPGGAVVLGESASVPVVLLPGGPLACLCAYDLIAARTLRRMAGRPGALPYRRRWATLGQKLVSSIGRLELSRVRLDGDRAEPIATAEGRVLATAVRADGFVLVPEQAEGYPQGTTVEVHLYDEHD